MRIPNVAALLLAIAVSASAIPLTPPTYGTTAYPVSTPVVASNGHGFLTLWTVNNFRGSHVYGSLADSPGNVTTPNAFLVLPNETVSQLFAYNALYVAIVTGPSGNSVPRIAYISADGRFLGFGASLSLPPTTLFARAFNGHDFFTVGLTSVSSPPGTIAGDVVTIDGTVVRTNIPIAVLAGFDVAASGSDFVVATTESSGVFAQRFRADGSLISGKIQIGPPAQTRFSSIAVASSGEETAIAWMEPIAGASPTMAQLHVATIRADGTVIGRSDLTLPFDAMQMVWTGSEYLLLLGTTAGRVARDGSATLATASPRIQTTRAAVSVDAVFSAGVLYDNTFYRDTVIGQSILPGNPLTIHQPSTLSNTLRRQTSPVAASNGLDDLAIWVDQTSENSRLESERIDASGRPITGEQIEIDGAEQSINNSYNLSSGSHAIAFGSSVYLVIWSHSSQVLARRIDRFGNVLDANPIVLAATGYFSDQPVVWDGTSFVVILRTGGGAGSQDSVLRVTEAGGVTTIANVGVLGLSSVPSISWDGARFLIVWPVLPPCNVSACPVGSPIAMVLLRLTASGAAVDAKPMVVDWMTSTSFHIATSGHEFMIAADVSSYGSPADYRLEARVVHTDGDSIRVEDAQPLFHWIQPMISNLIWNGREYVLAWTYGTGSSEWIGYKRLDRNLSVLTSGNIPIHPQDAIDRPALVSDQLGNVVILTSEVDTPGGVARIQTHSDDVTPNPAPPPTPYITSAVGSARTVTVTWQVAPSTDEGFIIERGNPYSGYFYTIGFAGGDERSATIDTPCSYCSGTAADLWVRMRTFNVAGVSVPTAGVPLKPPARNRAARH